MDTNKYRQDDIVFGTKWFEKHQAKLLWLLNTPIIKIWFRWVMRISKFDDIPLKTKILNIFPDSFSWSIGLTYFNNSTLLKTKSENINLTRIERRIARKLYIKIQKGKIEDEQLLLPTFQRYFTTHDKFSKQLYHVFKPLWYLFHVIDWVAFDRYEALTKLSFGFSTLTAYPDTTHQDACVYRNNVNQTWADITAGAGTGVLQNATSPYYVVNSEATSITNQWAARRKSIFCFLTSGLTAGASISDTVMSVYGQSSAYGTATLYVNVFTSNPANIASIQASDYLNVGTTKQCDTYITSSSWNTGGFNNYTFNATGRGNVSKTATSMFALDNDDSVGTPNWSSNSNQYVYGYFSGDSGTTRDPKIVVTYTLTAPILTTEAVTSITSTTATGNGTVTSDGGATVTERGTVISTSANPTTADHKDTASGTTGAYTTSITGLSANTLYHVRAYAINSIGTGYGTDVTFTTIAKISGQVTLAGSGVSGAVVRLIQQDTDTEVAKTTTDGSGNYIFSGATILESKRYHVCVEYTDGGSVKYNAKSLWEIQPVDV